MTRGRAPFWLAVAGCLLVTMVMCSCSDPVRIVAVKTYPELSRVELKQQHIPCAVLTLKVTPVERIYSDGSVKSSEIKTMMEYTRC